MDHVKLQKANMLAFFCPVLFIFIPWQFINYDEEDDNWNTIQLLLSFSLFTNKPFAYKWSSFSPFYVFVPLFFPLSFPWNLLLLSLVASSVCRGHDESDMVCLVSSHEYESVLILCFSLFALDMFYICHHRCRWMLLLLIPHILSLFKLINHHASFLHSQEITCKNWPSFSEIKDDAKIHSRLFCLH